MGENETRARSFVTDDSSLDIGRDNPIVAFGGALRPSAPYVPCQVGDGAIRNTGLKFRGCQSASCSCAVWVLTSVVHLPPPGLVL